MNLLQIARKSLRFHRRVNFSIALGVAAATAVLTGALIVGDSMRGSLRELTLDRLGAIDSIITGPGFFREELAAGMGSQPDFESAFQSVSPIIFFPNGSAEMKSGDGLKSLGQVNVQGISDDYWQLGDDRVSGTAVPGRGQVVINQVLATDLGIDAAAVRDGSARITIGVPKQKLLPADSALGSKDDLVERLVDLTVTEIVPAVSLGRFGLHPTQIPPRNAWVALGEMQSALNEGILKYKRSNRQANMFLIGGRSQTPATESQTLSLLGGLQPDLEDLGLSLRRVTQRFDDETIFDYYSLASDRLVIPDQVADSVRREFPKAQELFVYLANDIRKAGAPADQKGIPFSMVASVDLGESLRFPAAGGGWIQPPGENEIVVTRWAAEDQGLQIGDRIALSYFQPETTHGEESERTTELTVSGIVELTTPDQAFRVRRGVVTPAVFDQRPTMANDPDMTPVVPGLTDAESIKNWDLPFPTTGIRSQDDDYWDFFRTTPKAYVSLDTGRRLWSSRFGQTTSFRIEPGNLTETEIATRLISRFRADQHLAGLKLIPIRRNGLAASSGATPFDALFLGLSLFVIAAALVLVSLLFRLALQRRSDEMGALLAFGFRQKQVGRLWVLEMLGVCLAGALMGTLAGVGYAAVMLYGLRTWWRGAITEPFLTLHLNWWTLPLGLLLGVVICVITILWSVRAARKRSVRSLLNGDLESVPQGPGGRRRDRLVSTVIGVSLLAATGLTILAAVSLAGESQAGAFMTAGFLILVAALVSVWRFLRDRGARQVGGVLSVSRLATTGAARNPLRSTLTIGLVAVASFLILAISAFRLSPTREGTAGFNYVATTSQPVFADLDTPAGQAQVLRGDDKKLADTSRVLSLRYKSGQDASCNNLYQSTQPQVLGVTPAMIRFFDDPAVDRFAFTMTPAENPWHVLDQPTENGSIPVIIDKNTAWYSLKVYLPGTEFTVDYDSGESVTFRLAGLLSNSVLQGNLLISESNFTRIFPDLSGYRFFLMNLDRGTGDEPEIDRLAVALSDSGFDARRADELLAGFLAVQNTYLSTFQSLGFLGLLLGTFGLAAVQLRSVIERRRELGLLQAVGFSRSQLAGMIAIENIWLLFAGLAIGIGAALVTTLPHFVFGDASVPWLELLGMFAFIAVVGLLTSWLASRNLFRAPLIESLRAS